MIRRSLQLLAATALAATAAPAAAQTIAITGGTVALGDGSEPIQGGTVVIRDGRDRRRGAGRRGSGRRTASSTPRGKWVTPGIVAGFSRLGLAEVDCGDGRPTTSARTAPFSAAIDVAPAINPDAAPIAVNRADGVTRAIVAPSTGKSIFAGQGAVIDTGADMEPITRARAFPVRRMGEDGRGRRRAAAAAAAHVLFRNALREARDRSPVDARPLATRRRRRPADPGEGAGSRQSEREPLLRSAAQRGRAADPLRRGGSGARCCRGGRCCWSMSSAPATSSQVHRPQARIPAPPDWCWSAPPRAGPSPTEHRGGGHSGDRLGAQRSCPPRSSSSPRPRATSAGCAPPGSRCRSG